MVVEGEGGGAPGIGAEIPSAHDEDMIRQAVPLQPVQIHSGADIHLLEGCGSLSVKYPFTSFNILTVSSINFKGLAKYRMWLIAVTDFHSLLGYQTSLCCLNLSLSMLNIETRVTLIK